MTIDGLHHVTAVCDSAAANRAFFTGPMGQRLVKRTVNFDDPSLWHLYYGQGTGVPGSIMTYFPVPGARRGRAGAGATSAVAYATPDVQARLAELRAAGVAVAEGERLGAPVWTFGDPDGLGLSLEQGAEGFAGVTLWLADPEPTARLLADVFGYEPAGEAAEPGGHRLRLSVAGDAPGRVVDLWRADRAQAAQPGAGTVHHIAFRARDRDHQDALADRVRALGIPVTDRRDRNYFDAVYFREPGGVLFEIATDPPGFTVDEPAETLGTALKLPAQFEARRAQITAALPPL